MAVADLPKAYFFAGFRLDLLTRQLTGADGEAINLSSRAFDTLLALVERRGMTLSKKELMAIVWPNVVVEENNLNQAISSLRKALGDSKSESRFIKTIPGRGYSFIAPLDSPPEVAADTPGDDPVTSPQATSGRNQAIPDMPPLPPASSRGHLWLMLSPLAVLLLAIIGLILWNTGFNGQGGNTGRGAVPVAAVAPLQNSIAVLPFADLNPGESNDLFSLGLHDELISQLSKVSSLNVIARSSVIALDRQELTLPEIGNLLKVQSVITGTILFVGDEARINLQMLDPATSVTLWSSTYEADTRELDDMLTLQRDIALNVVDALEAEINQQEASEIGRITTTSFDAYQYNLAAKRAYYQQDFAKALELGERAISLDPNFFDALYLFSNANTVLMGTPLPGMTTRDHYLNAMNSANRMIEINPSRPEGYLQRAVAQATGNDWEGVAREYARLQSMNISLSRMNFLAPVLMSLGEFQSAIDILEANMIDDPLNLYGRGFMLAAYEAAGNRRKAREAYAEGEELHTEWWGDSINVFLSLGRHEPVVDVFEIPNLSPALQGALLNVNDTEIVASELENYLQETDRQPSSTIYYAAIAAYIGEHDEALDLMQESLEAVGFNFFYLWLPVFDETRKLERFEQMLRSSGLVDYWENHGWPEICHPDSDGVDCPPLPPVN